MKEHFCEFSLSRKHYERKIVANLIKQWNTQYLTLVDLFEQFDKPYYYHAEIIFFFFISCQTKFNSNLLIQLYLHFITFIWKFIWKLFLVEMQQVTYITIPCLSTFNI